MVVWWWGVNCVPSGARARCCCCCRSLLPLPPFPEAKNNCQPSVHTNTHTHTQETWGWACWAVLAGARAKMLLGGRTRKSKKNKALACARASMLSSGGGGANSPCSLSLLSPATPFCVLARPLAAVSMPRQVGFFVEIETQTHPSEAPPVCPARLFIAVSSPPPSTIHLREGSSSAHHSGATSKVRGPRPSQ